MALIQLFENLFSEKLAPDKVDINVFDVKNIQEDFVISRSFNGKVLSRYRDNLWDLRSYRSNPSQHGILNFLRINYNCISDAKEIMFLLFLFGSGKKELTIFYSNTFSLFQIWYCTFIRIFNE